ncbi:MAG: radical SAM family heme chaperone HemW [Proteobacteria bacterium]|nr:radical SAM family heme chaperone HemW [Pseudomonadota bacterium]
MNAADPGFGVYVHWPFCASKCPYCDFNSHVEGEVDHRRWRDALIAELGWWNARAPGRKASSVFFGGGTPSRMAPETVHAVLRAIEATVGLLPDAEITLEANPSASEAERFRAFRDAGCNRVSIGVQALDDDALRFLGRAHGAAEALAAIERARDIFPRFSFDLIYARPGQSAQAWRAELARGLQLARGHLSLYQLTIEPGTAFAKQKVPAADEETALQLFNITQEMTEDAGLPLYEISNHARPGDESRHNLTYWRGGFYIGIGPGAHGRLPSADGNTIATRATPDPARWLNLVETRGHGTAAVETLDASERMTEMIMVGLRLKGGIERATFLSLTGRQPEDALDRKALARLVEAGLAASDGAGVRLTSEGRTRLDSAVRLLLG